METAGVVLLPPATAMNKHMLLHKAHKRNLYLNGYVHMFLMVVVTSVMNVLWTFSVLDFPQRFSNLVKE